MKKIVIAGKTYQNPLEVDDVFDTYNGHIDSYQFTSKYFEDLYLSIQKLLPPDKKITSICSSKARYKCKPTHTRYTFIASNNDKSFIWYRYSSKSIGSDYNIVCHNKQVLKVTQFIKMNTDDIQNFIQ